MRTYTKDKNLNREPKQNTMKCKNVIPFRILYIEEVERRGSKKDMRDTVSRLELAIAGWDENTTQCHLTFKVSPGVYRRIDTEALFNLKAEILSVQLKFLRRSASS